MNKYVQAQYPNTPPEALQILATDDGWIVRAYVASNPNTSIEILQTLAEDDHYSVRLWVGRNPNSTEICRRLVLMTNDKKFLSKTP